MRPTLLLIVGASMAAGCAGQNSQLATCQAEKEQLLATISTQRDTTRALNEQVASLESRLDQAEKQLARAGGTTRLSSVPAKVTASPPTTTKAESLPWRAPAAKDAKVPPQPAPPVSGQRASNAATTLAELAKRERGLSYDAAKAAARLDLPLEFRDGGAELSAADKTRLDEVSRLLRSEGARELPIVIAGASGERTQVVADYLDRHGIPGERLLVTSTASRARPAGDQNVSIYLAGDNSPLLAEARGQSVKR
jgi:hypothetical protein